MLVARSAAPGIDRGVAGSAVARRAWSSWTPSRGADIGAIGAVRGWPHILAIWPQPALAVSTGAVAGGAKLCGGRVSGDAGGDAGGAGIYRTWTPLHNGSVAAVSRTGKLAVASGVEG
jgi:hypothetical protein